MPTQLTAGSPVYSPLGTVVGYVTDFAVTRATKEVRHLVVEVKGRPGTFKLVPLSLLANTGDGALTLQPGAEELSARRDFTAAEYDRVPIDELQSFARVARLFDVSPSVRSPSYE